MTVYLYGGAVTEIQVTKGGIVYVVFSNSSGITMSGQVFWLDPGDSISVIYIAKPSWTWLAA